VQEQFSIPESGLSPDQALREGADAATLRALDQLAYYSERLPLTNLGPPTHDDMMHDRWCQLREPLEHRFVNELRAGTLVATALQKPFGLNSQRTKVPPEYWEFLTLDYKNAKASSEDIELVQIKILRPDESEDAMADNAPDGQPASLEQNNEKIRLSDDNAVLTLAGQRLIFRGKKQQAILRQLVDAYRCDQHLKTQRVLESAGTQVDSLAKAFRKNRHWDKLRKIIKQDQGVCWIEI
jgi:hypothetical protein